MEPLAAALRGRHLARGEHFVAAGEHRPELALLLAGSCRLYYPRPDGEECTTYFFFENHLLADYTGCLTGQPSQVSIQALEATKLVVFDYAVLRRLYDERPVYERFGRLLAEYHLLGTDARLAEHLLLSPEARYRALLAGTVLLGHSAFDRLLGYGLKYGTGFGNTHLGRVGAGRAALQPASH